MRRVLIIAACAASLLSVGPAWARDVATLSNVKGNVLVGTEKGFREISGTTGLKAGDRVVLDSGASAVLSYGPGCGMQLPPNSDVTVTEQSCTVSTQAGPYSMFAPLRPLGWGILTGIAAFIGAVI
jgi:hypothetical protein